MGFDGTLRKARVTLLVLAAASLVLGGIPSVAQHDPTAGESPSEPAADPEPLAAGLYWTGYDTCPDSCSQPTAAVLLAIEPSADAADARLADVPVGVLSLGYPLVVYTDELGIRDSSERGIAIVLGLFDTVVNAESWRDHLPAELGGGRVVMLAERPEPFGGEPGLPGDLEQRRVVRIQAGPAAPAYDVDAIVAASGDAGSEAVSADIIASGAFEPVCRIPGGAVYDVPVSELDTGLYYLFAPSRCDGEKVLVRWEDTLLDATVWRAADGTGRIRQVTDAECDSPFFTEWLYTPNGRSDVVTDERGSFGCVY